MYKVAVYAICKDESQFIDRWAQSVAPADCVAVLDNGSQDGSAELLREKGFIVRQEIITPWRFDAARNRSLELVPQDCDICVCLDLDEVLMPGWRQALEQAWSQGAEQVEYPYVWSFNPDGSDGISFWACKIHARQGFRWVNPVHEVLSCDHAPKTVPAPGLRVEHHADPSKSRAQYLPLLELAVQENPHNDRNMHYLGREYMFHGRWQDCIDTLTRHVSMPEATWADEKCASYRFMARAHQQLGQSALAENCLLQAAAIAPHLREPWVELARHYYQGQDWCALIWAAERALRIQNRPHTYITEAECWGALPWDLLSLGWHHLNQREKAIAAVSQAIALDPGDDRLKSNLSFFRAKPGTDSCASCGTN